MSFNSFGKILKFTTFGESHGPSIGCIVDGVPSNLEINEDIIQPFLDKRKPGTSKFVTQRKEEDKVKILSHTVMPWFDDQKRLKNYGDVNNIDSKFWYLLTGSKDKIYKIARESYFADEGFGKSVTNLDDFIHTEKFFLIDSKNKIRAIYNGTLPLETRRMIEDIKSLLK